jgi:hypothetical protein
MSGASVVTPSTTSATSPPTLVRSIAPTSEIKSLLTYIKNHRAAPYRRVNNEDALYYLLFANQTLKNATIAALIDELKTTVDLSKLELLKYYNYPDVETYADQIISLYDINDDLKALLKPLILAKLEINNKRNSVIVHCVLYGHAFGVLTHYAEVKHDVVKLLNYLVSCFDKPGTIFDDLATESRVSKDPNAAALQRVFTKILSSANPEIQKLLEKPDYVRVVDFMKTYNKIPVELVKGIPGVSSTSGSPAYHKFVKYFHKWTMLV